MNRCRRLLTLLIIALTVGPNPMAAVHPAPVNHSQIIRAMRIPLDPQRPTLDRIGALRLAEAWLIDSDNTGFGGYSAMAMLEQRRFLLGSDTGVLTGFTLNRDGTISRPFINPLPAGPGKGEYKEARDLESMAADPARGRIWTAYEHSNQIWRFSRGLARAEGHVAPPAMRDWNINGGPEGMARLSDGRFLVMAETTGAAAGTMADAPVDGATAALLFPADPVAHPRAQPLRFAYDSQGMGRVTDAAQMPNGQI
ncbi:MAG: esterase-like activity of phytase family protein, partial [Sphingopyxis sp.]